MTRTLATLSVAHLEAQDKALCDLDKVYSIRALRIAQELAEANRQLAEVDELLELLRNDLVRVDEQRDLWKARWVDWLEGDGVLHHGRGFTQQHAELGELENLLKGHQFAIQEQRDVAQARVNSARAEQAKISLQREALAQRRKSLLRAVAMQRESHHDEVVGENALASWYGSRVDSAAMGVE